MEPRDELEMLRKRKRLADLEAKAASAPAAAPPVAAAPEAPAAPGYQPSDIPGVGLLLNTAQATRNAVAKGVSGYAGLLGGVLPGPEGQAADWQKRTQETLSGPISPVNDPLVALPSAAINAGAHALDQTDVGKGFNNFVETTPGAKEGLEGGMDIATLLGAASPLNAARAPVVAGRDAIAASERLMGNRKGSPVPGTSVAGPGDNTYLASPTAAASRAGITVTPWEVGQQVAGSGEKVTGAKRAGFGTGAVNKDTAMGNAPRINEIAIRGMPDGITLDPRNGRIEPRVIEQAKNVERAKYDAVRRVPGEGASPELTRDLHGVVQGLDAVPDAVAKDVQRIAASKSGGGASTKLVDDIMELRQEATMDGKRAFNQNDPTARQLAGYKRQIADKLEEELARRGEAAGLQGVRETLKEARTNFAKLSTLDEATDQGFVDAARLEKVTEGGGYLSDGMADVAKHHEAAPISMTHPQRISPIVEPNARAGANPKDMALRTAQFLGGNFLTKQIGKSGVKSLNKELRSFAPPPEAPAPSKPTFDFERAPEQMGPPFPEGASSPVPPPAPNSVPPGIQPYDRLSDRLAPDFNPEVFEPGTGAPKDAAISSFLADTSPDTVPWDPSVQAPGKPRNTAGRPRYRPATDVQSPAGQGSISGDLGPVSEFPALNEGMQGPAMPDKPRGVTGPRSAQLSSPSLADDLQVGDQPPPRTPDFGPGDEFPGPATPQGPPPDSGVVSVTPTEHMVYHNGQVDGPYTTRDSADLVHAYLAEKNPAPVDNVSDMLTLYRGQPEGTANEGFFAPDRATAERYGSSVSEQQMNPADVQHAGSIEDLRALTGLGPDATIVDLVQAYKALPDRKKAVSWDLPPDMSGTPREYYKFEDAAPVGDGAVSDALSEKAQRSPVKFESRRSRGMQFPGSKSRG